MSTTEVAKKRGRPKKVVEEVSTAEEAKGKGTRNASTKAAPSPKASTTSANTKATKTVPKPAAKTTKTLPSKPASSKPVFSKTIPSKTSSEPKKPAVSSAPTPSRPTPVTPETSKILQKVAQAKAEQSRPPPQPSQPSSRPPAPNFAATPAPPRPYPRPISAREQFNAYPSPELPTIPPHSSMAPPPATAAFKGQLEANKYVLTGKVNPKYKSAARRITSIMVSIPIIIVVGWELYQRQFMGKEQKHFIRREEVEGKPI